MSVPSEPVLGRRRYAVRLPEVSTIDETGVEVNVWVSIAYELLPEGF